MKTIAVALAFLLAGVTMDLVLACHVTRPHCYVRQETDNERILVRHGQVKRLDDGSLCHCDDGICYSRWPKWAKIGIKEYQKIHLDRGH